MRVAALAVALCLGVAALLGVGSDQERAGAESVRCEATPVHGGYVHAGRFTGAIVPEYDVVDGRFRLRVGGYRDKASGLTQKIPWWISRRADVGRRLRIDARRLPPQTPRSFRQTLRRTTGVGDRRRWFYPSIITPPTQGCWRLRFRSGKTRGSLTVLVRN